MNIAWIVFHFKKKKKQNFDRDRHFHCMQMSLVMECGLFSAMIEMTRHVLITFFISGNDVISLESRPLNFLVIIHATSIACDRRRIFGRR